MVLKLKDLVENSVRNILCFDVKVDANENSTEIYIYNEDETILRRESWEITVTVLDNQLLFDFTFNNSAKRMQELYFTNFAKKRDEFYNLIYNIENAGWTIKVIPDGLENQNSSDEKKVPFSVNAKKILNDPILDKLNNISNHVLLFTSIVLMPLIPDDVLETASDEVRGMPEGGLTKVLVNKYERNPKNRAICISYHGSTCISCGFSFGDFYGEFAKGYIHVHHLTPVSIIGENYVINPIKDLVPLCPNCHNAVHLTNPPLSIQELKSRFGDK